MTLMDDRAATGHVGRSLRRKEDPRLITGQATYVDDLAITGMLHAAFVRSPEAHARIVSIDASSALERDEVVAVYTGEDLADLAGAENGDSSSWHPVQRAFQQHHGLQCGYCTPGMIMAAADLLERTPNPSEDEIRHGLEGNLCRCTGYHNIVAAVQEAAQVMGSAPARPEVTA